jgi:transcription initiation factor IIE alpha subunit
MPKIPVKIDSKIEILDTLEEAILIFLDKKTPPAMTSQQIADLLKSPYPTIHPKLKTLHEKGLIAGKVDQTPRPGKKRLLWEKKGEELNAILDRWREILQSE